MEVTYIDLIGDFLLTYIVLQNLVVDLIFALQHQPAAQLLPSRTGRGSLRGDLLSLGSWAVSDDFDVERITPLERHHQ
jgi:hypothetical protein